MGRHATLAAPGREPSALAGRPVRVELREPVELLGRALRPAFAALGLVVVDGSALADVVVWAIDPDGGSETLRRSAGPVPVLALVDQAGASAVAALRAAGARGVVARGADAATIVGAAITVAGGYCVFPAADTSAATRSQVERLDERELAWMRALARGAQVHSLARDEGWSEREMYRKLRNTYRKLRVPGRTEAIVALAQADLLDVR